MSKMMNYVVAYPYPPEPHRLSIYTYGGDVQQQGTMQQAQWLLAYAKQRSPDHPWAIYLVEFTPLASQEAYGPSHGIAK